MTREERAKQFMPFDAMKGLKEALLDREERHSRVQRRELSEDDARALSDTLQRIEKGMQIKVRFYCAFHETEKSGMVTQFNPTARYITLDTEKIYFEDIYSVTITEFYP